jgi:hypothetical protein
MYLEHLVAKKPLEDSSGFLFQKFKKYILLIILLLYWGYFVTFTKVLTIFIVEFTPSNILLYPHPQFPE